MRQIIRENLFLVFSVTTMVLGTHEKLNVGQMCNCSFILFFLFFSFFLGGGGRVYCKKVVHMKIHDKIVELTGRKYYRIGYNQFYIVRCSSGMTISN